MNDQFEAFLEKIKIEMQNQTKEILTQMDEKLTPLSREIEVLKLENKELKGQLLEINKKSRMNNLILFGLQETEKSSAGLMELTINKFKSDLNITLDNRDINKIYRLGKKDTSGKNRPTLITFVNSWKKDIVFQSRKQLQNVYVTEDYPKDILTKRKLLQQQLVEERKKGNFAIIKYDKLIVKEGTPVAMKRKERGISSSPEPTGPLHKQRINVFDRMRGRSNSMTLLGTTHSNNA